jgi:phospholipid/cholesterol/gamma-HCH transport system substrate-binding protein
MRSSSKERRTGAFVAIALLAGGAFVGYRLVQEYWLDRPFRVQLEMTHGYGLAPGNLVKMNGIPVGTVERLELQETGRVRAVVGVKRRYRRFLTEEARFALRRPMFIGEAWVEIQTQGSGDPLLHEGSVRDIEIPKEALAELGVTQERVTSMLDTIQLLLDDAGAILADVRAGKGNLGQFLNDTELYADLRSAIGRTNDLLEQTLQPGSTFSKLTSESKLYDELTVLVEEVRRTVQDLRGQEDKAAETLGNLNNLLKSAEKTTGEIQQIAQRVNRGEGTIGKLATDDALFVETRRILGELRETLEDLREQTPISTFMGALFSAF